MSKIPTAEELFYNSKYNDYGLIHYKDAAKIAIRLTKLHVKAALEAAAQKAELGYADGRYELPDYAEEPFNAVVDDLGNAHYIDRNSILNAYPDELIK